MNENNLRKLRKSLHLTTRDLAKYTGIVYSTITLLEKGKRLFRQVHIDKLTDFFNVTADYLLGKNNVGIYVHPEFGDEIILFSEEEYNKSQELIETIIMKRPITITGKIDNEPINVTPYTVYREIKGSAEDYDNSISLVDKINTSLKKMSNEQLKKTYSFIKDFIL